HDISRRCYITVAYPGRDSNPHCPHFECGASCLLGYRGSPPGRASHRPGVCFCELCSAFNLPCNTPDLLRCCYVTILARARDTPGVVTRPCRRRRSEEHTSELQSRENLVCRLLLEKKKIFPILIFKRIIQVF